MIKEVSNYTIDGKNVYRTTERSSGDLSVEEGRMRRNPSADFILCG